MKPLKYFEKDLLGVNELATKAKNTHPLNKISFQLLLILNSIYILINLPKEFIL